MVIMRPLVSISERAGSTEQTFEAIAAGSESPSASRQNAGGFLQRAPSRRSMPGVERWAQQRVESARTLGSSKRAGRREASRQHFGASLLLYLNGPRVENDVGSFPVRRVRHASDDDVAQRVGRPAS